MSSDHLSLWDHEYQTGRGNRYPFDEVISFVFRNFGSIPLHERKNCSILDLGCGGGNHVKMLKDLGFDNWGADGAPTAIDLTNKLIDEPNCERVKVCNFLKLPFEGQQFDAVIDRQAIGHNTKKDISTIISEVHRILKPGGLLLSCVFGLENTGFSFGEDIGTRDYANFKGGLFGRSHLVHAFDLEEIKDLYSDWIIHSVVHDRRNEVYPEQGADLFDIYVIVAQKPQ